MRFHVRYSNDSTALKLETRSEEFDGFWKVTKVTKVAP